MAASGVDAAPRPATHTVNRWLIPVGAVAVHICIGSVYAWSTFNRPFQALLPNAPEWFSPPYTTYSTALVLLGLSAAFGGPWVERRGPRVAATAAALLFGCGLLIGGIGLALRQSVLVFLGMGVIGGMGCGLGYIAPVSTLVKWFPDRRGMATGMAIMGFGGGAALASPLNVRFMNWLGVPAAVMTLGAIYFVMMLIGARILRRPPEGWKPAGWNPPENIVSQESVTRNAALRTPQFYLLWGILFINVTAGIGILAQASPIVQDIFQKTAVEAATFVLLLSIFNLIGRFFWASGSDYIGRRNTYIDVLCRPDCALSADSRHRRPRRVGRLPCQPVRGGQHVRRRIRHHSSLPGRRLRAGQRRRDSRSGADRLERGRHRRTCDHHRAIEPGQGRAGPGSQPRPHL